MKQLEFLDGDEWQNLIVQLLILRYGHDFVTVPAKHKGDLGLDGFSRDGNAYQCYAPTEPISTAQRYENHRDKLTEDVGKLNKNRALLSQLLDGLELKRWVFVVPKHDSRDLNLHAATKAAEVRELNLPFVSSEMQIDIATITYFMPEYRALFDGNMTKLSIPTLPVTPSAESWAAENDKLVKVIDMKLEKVEGLTEPGLRTTYRKELLDAYLQGSNILEYFSTEFPNVHQLILRRKEQRQRFLVLDNANSKMKVPDVAAAFSTELMEHVRSIDADLSEVLSWSAIAEWLMDCALHPGVRP